MLTGAVIDEFHTKYLIFFFTRHQDNLNCLLRTALLLPTTKMSVILPLLLTPSDFSSLAAAELQAIHLRSRPAISELMLRTLLKVFKPGASTYEKTLQMAAEILFATIKPKDKTEDAAQDICGPFLGGRKCSARLQHIITRMIKMEPEDVDDEMFPPIFVCCKQVLGVGSNDVTVYRNSQHRELHPRVIWEIGVHNRAADGQLLAYVNNADTVMGPFYHLSMLGVVVLLPANRTPTYKTKVKATPTQPKLASVLISEGVWNIGALQNILRVVMQWSGLSSDNFTKPAQPLTALDTTRNVLMVTEDDKQVMYKAFDSRATLSICRSAQYNLFHIPGAVVVLDADRLQVLKYPRIPGDHLPTHSKAAHREYRPHGHTSL